jgi:hypothetical protein
MTMNDMNLIEQIRARPAIFGLNGSYGQCVTFLEGFDLGRSGGLLRGFSEWLVVRRGVASSLGWRTLVLEMAFPDAEIRRPDSLNHDQSLHATDCLFSLLMEFMPLRDDSFGLARMYTKYLALNEPGT